MTVYKGLPYLKEAIDSVLSQTFRDFEFLIINDASPDGSAALIESYTDPRIRLLHNEKNLGQTNSMNRGLREARGRLIARLDHDDVCLPDRLAKQAAVFERDPDLVVLGSWGHRIDGDSRRIGIYRERSADYGIYLANLLLTRCPILHSSVMFRRDVVLANGGYDASFNAAEDYELWSRLASRALRGFVLQEPLVMVRSHSAQQSASKTAIQLDHNNRAHQKMVDAFCPSDSSRAVASLLRMDREFWKECSSKALILRAMDDLDATISEMRSKLALGPQDASELRRVLYTWIGPGARIRRMIGVLPSFLFYPAFIALCPLFIPNARLLGFRVLFGAQKLLRGFRS
jgi:glycosyltransferase involved in cell wall biosynthesis